MAVEINGTDIPVTENITVNGTSLEVLHVNGVEVWRKLTLPGPITDFSASSGLINKITMTWTSAERADSHDLYEGSTLIKADVASPYDHNVAGPYTGTYHVKAINDSGSIDSNTDEGDAIKASQPPGNFTLQASTGLQEVIRITWTAAEGASSYDVYENGNLRATNQTSPYNRYYSGAASANFFIRAKNDDGTNDSNTASGSCIARPPDPDYPQKITDFAATEDVIDMIGFTWTVGAYTDYVDLYENDVKIGSNVQSGVIKNVEGPFTANYYVKSVNGYGQTTSNHDTGTALEQPAAVGNVTINYNQVSGANPETVSGSNGSFTFTPPANVKNLYVLVIGGGGSGACVQSGSFGIIAQAGGGFVGGVATHTFGAYSTVTSITIGKGGEPVKGGNYNGEYGNPSLFKGDITVQGYGGIGGYSQKPDSTDRSDYHGDGSDNDGTKVVDDYYGIAWGGEGGYATHPDTTIISYQYGGNGVHYNPAGSGGNGGGGGGVTRSNGGGEPSGAGGDGLIIIEWK